MRFAFLKWKNISIAIKLYFVVGVMAFLIVGELLTLQFAMKQISAARAFVGAESSWSKAQKNAVFSLQEFGITKNEEAYRDFLHHLEVPEGDHVARIELLKKNPDMQVVREGFIKGRVHPDDVEPMVELLQEFYWVSYLAKAIEIWTKGDELLFQLKDAGEHFRTAVLSGDTATSVKILEQVKRLNQELTVLEENFSFQLGEGSRWLEYMVLFILAVTVLTVESVGLALIFMTSRAISRGLTDLKISAAAIGQGDFTRTVNVKSADEIGQLGESVNLMAHMLQKSYRELEQRVEERTAHIAQLLKERDEFLSIASHELRTPLSSLIIQLQKLLQSITQLPATPESEKLQTMTSFSVKQTKRVSLLLDELLDLTRIRIGRLEIHPSPCDLVPIVNDVLTQLASDITRSGSIVTLDAGKPAEGNFDSSRMDQVVTNLLSNALKYGKGKPIGITVKKENQKVILQVKDQGVGIPANQQAKIFDRFERGSADPNITGLGLGLYIIKQIVQAHGGKISVESEPGKGACFTVEFDAVDAKRLASVA